MVVISSHLVQIRMERNQKVELKSPNDAQIFFYSQWGTIERELLQALIVGPLIFITYTCNLPLKCHRFLFGA
jgi:hypothetical protein